MPPLSVQNIFELLTFAGSLIGVWVSLNNRMTLLEARLGFGDEKFQNIDKRSEEHTSELQSH